MRYKFSLQNVPNLTNQVWNGRPYIFHTTSFPQNGTEWHDLGHFRRLVMVSTDNVFVFSDWGCRRRRDRGTFPRKATGFLADLRVFLSLAKAGGLAATRVDGHCQLRHVARNGDTARLETCATSACRQLACFQLCLAGWSATGYRSHCSRRGPVCWLARRGEWGLSA